MRSIHGKWLLLPLAFNGLLCALVGVVLHTYLSHQIGFLLGVGVFFMLQNLVTLPLLYAFDKRQSQRPNCERVPERVLHIFILLGGALGSLLGQQVFRHKTRKRLFYLSNTVGIATTVAMILAWLNAF